MRWVDRMNERIFLNFELEQSAFKVEINVQLAHLGKI